MLPAGGGCAPSGGRRSPLARPLRGFGVLRLRHRGHWRLSAAFFWAAPPVPCCARAAPACCRSVAAAVFGVGLSPAPPRPAAPAGGSGERRAYQRAVAPRRWRVPPGCFPLPSPAPSHRSARSSLPPGGFAGLDLGRCRCLREGLTFSNTCAIMAEPSLTRRHSPPALCGCPWAAERTPPSGGVLFLGSARHLSPAFRGSLCPARRSPMMPPPSSRNDFPMGRQT